VLTLVLAVSGIRVPEAIPDCSYSIVAVTIEIQFLHHGRSASVTVMGLRWAGTPNASTIR
jgi:hypothetical protein